jgi:starch-binding outer membrane protein, SusD/RagB family
MNTILNKIPSKRAALFTLAVLVLFPMACMDDLLDVKPTTELEIDQFWRTENDATIALMGTYSAVRPLFDRDYYFDGQGEYLRVRGTSSFFSQGNLRLGDAYNAANVFGSSYSPSGYGADFDIYFRYLYGGVNRTNYVIENVKRMLQTASSQSVPNLESILGEARLLRGMVYFRLISMWSDVPYYTNAIGDIGEEPFFATLSRLPLKQVKDSILLDFTYAFEKLPTNKPSIGRASKPAALAFRGKLQLYWACWNKFGWPELSTFTPDAGEATAAYTAAAADFDAVIKNYGLDLFRGGAPGQIDVLGKADVLPNYFHLFTPLASNDITNTEFIMSFNHGGIGTSQGEELMRDFSGRSHEFSQLWVMPRFEIADKYQLTTTGDYAPALVTPRPASTSPTDPARTTLNAAVNPQSYVNRDYRMKSTIMWDYEMSIGSAALKSTGFVPFIFTVNAQPVTIGGVKYTTYNDAGAQPRGYVFRKFLRNYAGQGRSDGDFSWPVMRLADVFLMYAEATNEINGPQADAIALVNRVRTRGNLPALSGTSTANRNAFFAAIEQERIIELIAEGHRGFDLRRWRSLERIWGPPGGNGVQTKDTHGANWDVYYRNAIVRTYEQNYIFRIPPGERDRNPNLTQNTPWL